MKLGSKLLVVLCLISYALSAQVNEKAKKYGEQVSEAALRDNLSILASDAMEGRETGKRGQKMAAAFIANYFDELGLKAPVNGSYYQPVNLYSVKSGEVYVKAGDSQYKNLDDLLYFGSGNTNGEVTQSVVFAGNGSETDFEQVDVKDKAVVLFVEGMRVTNSKAITMAREKGASSLLVCNTKTQEDFDNFKSNARGFASGGRLSVKKPDMSSPDAPLFIISPAMTEKITGQSFEKLTALADAGITAKAMKKIKPTTVQIKTTAEVQTVKTENVLGYLEGTDKKDEVIVVTAHYDHIGVRASGEGDLINNGADDDGSGTVAVMELARLFTKAKQEDNGPKRSILFMTVTGEEKGLLGSAYYTENPIYPLANTVVNLNMDMIGRRDKEHADNNSFVYVVGSDKLSTDLHTLCESINSTYTKLDLDYTYNDENHPSNIYRRSDHWNFAKNNIPIIFYFDGIHDDYHRPSDEIEKIEFDHMAKRTKLVFYTAWEIANRDQRITSDKK
ncbi:MAG: M28 family peptidase [Flammeovirgaceae bacterium]|nr:M28 family peptidase [Flammeovirgaceae bacterium]